MGNTGTKENTDGINNVQTYQHVIAATNLDMLRKTVKIEPVRKKQRTERTNITILNAIIAK